MYPGNVVFFSKGRASRRFSCVFAGFIRVFWAALCLRQSPLVKRVSFFCRCLCWCLCLCLCLRLCLCLCLYLSPSHLTLQKNKMPTHCSLSPRTPTHTHTPDFVILSDLPECNTLQHTATHCNTLQHTATHCNGMWCTMNCQALQRTASR